METTLETLIRGNEAAAMLDFMGKSAMCTITQFRGTITGVYYTSGNNPQIQLTALIAGKPVEHWVALANLSA